MVCCGCWRCCWSGLGVDLFSSARARAARPRGRPPHGPVAAAAEEEAAAAVRSIGHGHGDPLSTCGVVARCSVCTGLNSAVSVDTAARQNTFAISVCDHCNGFCCRTTTTVENLQCTALEGLGLGRIEKISSFRASDWSCGYSSVRTVIRPHRYV